METDSASQPQQQKPGGLYWIDSEFRTDKTTQELPEHVEELIQKYSKEYGKPVETLYSWDPDQQSFVPVESDGKLQRLLVARRQELTQGKLSTNSLSAIVRAIHRTLECENLKELPYEPLYGFVLQGKGKDQLPRFTWKAPSHQSLQAQRSASVAVVTEVSYHLLRILGEAFTISATFEDRRKPFNILSGCLGQILADAARPQVTDHVIGITLMLVSLLLADDQVVQTLEPQWVTQFAYIVKNARFTKIWLCTNAEVWESGEESRPKKKKKKKTTRTAKHETPSSGSKLRSQSTSDSSLGYTDSFVSFFSTQQVSNLLTTSIEGKVRIRRQRMLGECISALLGVDVESADLYKFVNSRFRQSSRRKTPFTCWLEDIFKTVNAEKSSHTNLLEYLQQVSDSVCIDQNIAIVVRRILAAKLGDEALKPCIELLKEVLDDHADASVSVGNLDSPRVLALEGILLNVPPQDWKTSIGRTLIERILGCREESLEPCYFSLKHTISNIQRMLDELPRSIASFKIFERDERLRYQLDILLLTWRSVAVSGMDTIDLCVQFSSHIHDDKRMSLYDCYCRSHLFTCDLRKRVSPLAQTKSTWEYVSIINMVQQLLDAKIRIPARYFNWQDHLREKNNVLVKGFLQYRFSENNLRRLLSVLSPRELYKASSLSEDGEKNINLWSIITNRSTDLQPFVFWHAVVGNMCLGLFSVTLNCDRALEHEEQRSNCEEVWQWETPLDNSKCVRNRVGTAIVEFAAQHIWILVQHLATHKRNNCNLHSDTYSPLNYGRALKLISASLNMTIHELFPYWDKLSEWFLPESTGSKPSAGVLNELTASAHILNDRNVANPSHEDVPWIDPFNALTLMQCVGAHCLQNTSSTASQYAVAAATNALLHPQLSVLVHNGDFSLHIIRRMLRQVSLRWTVAEPQKLLEETEKRLNTLLEAHWQSPQSLHRASVSATDSGRVVYFRSLMVHHGFLCWWIVTGDSERLLKQMPTLITIAMDGCLQCMEWWKQVKLNDSVNQSKSTIILQGVISRTFQYSSCSFSKLLYLMKLCSELKTDVPTESTGSSALVMVQSVSSTMASLCWSMMQFPDFEVLSHSALASWCLGHLCKDLMSTNIEPWGKLSNILLRWIVSCARMGVFYGGMFSCPEHVAGEREAKIYRWGEWLERQTIPSQEKFPDPTPFFTIIFQSHGSDVCCSSFDVFLDSKSSGRIKAKVWTFHEFFRTVVSAFHVLCTVSECNVWLLHGEKQESYSSKREHSLKTKTKVGLSRHEGLSALMFSISACNRLSCAISDNVVEDCPSKLSQRMLINCAGTLLESTPDLFDAALSMRFPACLYIQCAKRKSGHIVRAQALRVLIAMFDVDSARLINNLEEIFGRAALEEVCVALLEKAVDSPKQDRNSCSNQQGNHDETSSDQVLDELPVPLDLLHSHASGALVRLSSKHGSRERLMEVQIERRMGDILLSTEQVDVVSNCLLTLLNVSTLYSALPRLVAVAKACLIFARSPIFYSLQISAVRILQNLQKHPKNRSVLYQLELQSKGQEFFADIRELSKHRRTVGKGSQAQPAKSLDDVHLEWLVRQSDTEDADSSENALTVKESIGFSVARGGALDGIRQTYFSRERYAPLDDVSAAEMQIAGSTILESESKALTEKSMKRHSAFHPYDRRSESKIPLGLPELASRLNISFAESCRVRGPIESEFEDTRGMPDFYFAHQEQAPGCLSVSVNCRNLGQPISVGDVSTSYSQMFESYWWAEDAEKELFYGNCDDCMYFAFGLWLPRPVAQHASEHMTRYIGRSTEKQHMKEGSQEAGPNIFSTFPSIIDYSGTDSRKVTNEPDLELAMVLFQQIEDEHRLRSLSGEIETSTLSLMDPKLSKIRSTCSVKTHGVVSKNSRWDPGKVQAGKEISEQKTENTVTVSRPNSKASKTEVSDSYSRQSSHLQQQTEHMVENFSAHRSKVGTPRTARSRSRQSSRFTQSRNSEAKSSVQMERKPESWGQFSISAGKNSLPTLDEENVQKETQQEGEEDLTNPRTLLLRMKRRQRMLGRLLIATAHSGSSVDRAVKKVKDQIVIDGVDTKHVFSFTRFEAVNSSSISKQDEEKGEEVATSSEATLLTFPHTEGAEYCANLYPHFKLENGVEVHCYYQRNFHRAPFGKVRTPFNPPTRLHDAGLVAPPPPPHPLRMETDDSRREFVTVSCIVHEHWKQPSGWRVESKHNLMLYSLSPSLLSAQNELIPRMDLVLVDLETLHGVSSSKSQKYTTMSTDAFVQYATQASYPEESSGKKVLESEKEKINKATTAVVLPIKFEFGEVEEDDQTIAEEEEEDNRIDIFLARYRLSESKDLYNKQEVYEKAWRLDVDRIMRKKDLPVDFSRYSKPDLEEILHNHLYPQFELIWRLFDFYSTIDLTDVFVISQIGYKKFYTHLGLPDSRLKQGELPAIFQQVNVEEGEGEEDLLNPDKSLMRFEFVEVLFRFACHLYSSLDSLDQQIDQFVSNELTILTKQPEFAAFYPFFGDEYREHYLYQKEVIAVLRKHFTNLNLMHRAFSRRQILETTSTGTRRVEVGGKSVFRQKKPLMSYEGWLSLLQQTKIISTDFGKREAAMIFVMSRTRFSNDMDVRDYMESIHLNQTDFLEALCRVAHIKPFPTDEYLEKYCNNSTFEYCKLAAQRKLPRKVTPTPDISPFDITQKEPLEKLFEKLMGWLTYTIDEYVGNGDGKLDAQDFRRIQQLMFG